YQIERWDPVGGSFVWVLVPQIDAASDADHVWMYFGGPATPPVLPASATWPDDLSVWHFQPAFTDATTWGHGLWDDGSTREGAGIAGVGRALDGSDAQLKCADHPDLDLQAAFTVSAWVRIDAWDDPEDSLITKGATAFRLQRCAG